MSPLTEQCVHERIEAAVAASPKGLASLVTELQGELRQIARSQRRRNAAAETLSTTALVNEAYLKFSGSPDLFDAVDRQHFLALAARAMRHILVNHVRDRLAQKRGGGAAVESLDDHDVAQDFGDLLELNDALEQLERARPRLAQVVQLRYFGGLGEAEVAEVLEVDVSTVQRDWVKARGWLYERLHPDALR
ncbi:ECF-type sigma factor [Dokdonella sp.]|uniref:ECF-type sigma factor n=1 Tax=Dokdonella sp. TaxID=2291710 RepID=UPI0037846CC0